MTLPVTIAGHLTRRATDGLGPGLWRIHQGGIVLHELWGYPADAKGWIREHGLTYDPTLVNP